MKKLLFAMLLALITINISANTATITYLKPSHNFPEAFFISYPAPKNRYKDRKLVIYKDLNTDEFYIRGGFEAPTMTILPQVSINRQNPFSSLNLDIPQLSNIGLSTKRRYRTTKEMLQKYNKLGEKLIILLDRYEKRLKKLNVKEQTKKSKKWKVKVK